MSNPPKYRLGHVNRCKWLKGILLFIFALFSQHSIYAQNLWIGAQVGINSPLSYGVRNSDYLKNGFHAGEPMLDLQSRFLFKNGLFLSGGFMLSKYTLGLKYRKRTIEGFFVWGYPSYFEVKDLRFGFGKDFALTKALRFAPEVAVHALLDDDLGGGGGTFNTSTGVRFQFASITYKPTFLPAISVGSSLDVRFRNGMIFRVMCRLETAFSEVARTVIRVYDPNGNLLESYDYNTIPVMLQTGFGFHYPISRIWRGKPW